jgi:hypothetical protein
MAWSEQCDCCHASFDEIEPAPMLREEVWEQLTDYPGVQMCARCMFARAAESKVELTLASLMPCAFNLFHWPLSWFNRFAQRERPPTIINPAWRAAMANLRTRPSPPPALPPLGQTTRAVTTPTRRGGFA